MLEGNFLLTLDKQKINISNSIKKNFKLISEENKNKLTKKINPNTNTNTGSGINLFI